MKKLGKFLSVKYFLGLQGIVSLIFLFLVKNLDILPHKYFLIITAAIILLFIINFFIQFKAKEKSTRAVISRVISVLLSLLMIFACFEVNSGMDLVSKFTSVDYQTNSMSVIVMGKSDYTKINHLDHKKIGIVNGIDEDNVNNAMKKLDEVISVDYGQYVDFERLVDNLYDGHVDAILVNEAYRSMLEDVKEAFTDETRVIYQIELEEKIENLANDGAVDDGIFNICITGIDTYGPVSTKSRSDVNMIMTVNMNTHKILLTGIPRDYYVTLASKNAKDKLTHSGIYGVNETVNTISQLLDVRIDYYFRINFTSLVNLVDVLGGVDVYSDRALFQGSDIEIKEGINHMNGQTALAFSRERYSYTEGDNHRIQNQQAVMMAIINKLISPSVITHYKDVLNQVEGTFETNMSSQDILKVIQKQLDNMQGYTMTNKYLTGTGTMKKGLYSMPKSNLYTMIPNEQEVKDAKQKINEIYNGQ